MEAVGSRLGRASSRYGTPSVFSGPVRKWKKKWVHVSPTFLSSHHTSHSSHANTNNAAASRLLLCRWTPASAAAADDDNTSANASDEPPRRKFRYTPIAVLEEQKKVAARKEEIESMTETGQSTARLTNVTHEMHGKLNMNETSLEETQESNVSQLELGLGFKDDNGDDSQNIDDQLKRTSPSGRSTN